MKKVIVFILLSIFSLYLFAASTGSMSFNVHWLVNNIKTTTIDVLPYSGEGTLPQDAEDHYLKTIEPLLNSSVYNVCLVRYRTNEKGTHKIEFSATPMVSNDTLEEFGYSLYITYNNGFPVILDVIPGENENAKVITFSVIGSGEVVADIYLDAMMTELDVMDIGDYSSIVTIARISE